MINLLCVISKEKKNLSSHHIKRGLCLQVLILRTEEPNDLSHTHNYTHVKCLPAWSFYREKHCSVTYQCNFFSTLYNKDIF